MVIEDYLKRQEAMENTRLYLKEASLSGYRSIRNTNINFIPDLNIIIGKNAAGKTNFLSFLSKVLSFSYDELFNFNTSLLFEKGKTHFSIFTSSNLHNTGLEMQDSFGEINVVNEVSINEERLQTTTDGKTPLRQLKSHNLTYYTTLINHGLPLNYYLIDKPFSFSFSHGTKNSDELLNEIVSDENPFFVRCILTSLFRDLSQDNNPTTVPALINAVLEKLDTIKPFVQGITSIEDIRFSDNKNVFYDQEKDKFIISNLFIEFKVGGEWLPFSSLSDGTKRIFYIISEVAFETDAAFTRHFGISIPEQRIILMEEPELGIHPHQLHQLMLFLKEQSRNKQIILTTHSPQVLDVLAENELHKIIITANANGQGTTFRNLNEDEITKAQQYINKVGELSYYWLHSDLEK